jgi:anti-sigma factor RsiW
MTHHLSTERMHDMVDGLLPPAEEQAAREHLATCAACRRARDDLAAVVAEVGALPQAATVPEGVWEGIEARMSLSLAGRGEVRETDAAAVLELPVRRRLAFTLPQLAAAAIVVALLSSGTVWMAMSRPSAETSVTAEAPGPGQQLGPAARVAASGDAAYDQALLELQTLVDRGRGVLAPETVQALDRSLETIDEAISNIREALAKDPSSQLLARMLVDQQRTKLRVLRQAATAMQPRS